MAGVQILSWMLSMLVFIATLQFESEKFYCMAESYNNTPIFIESLYQMNGERCVIQEAAYSTANSTKLLQERLDTPFNDSTIPLPPGTISNDDPTGPRNAYSFSSAFSYVQDCSDEICTLVLRLAKSQCGTTADTKSAQYYVKTTNVQTTGISNVKILSDGGVVVEELKDDSLAYPRRFSLLTKYNTNSVTFQYSISDPLQFDYDFIIDACCVL